MPIIKSFARQGFSIFSLFLCTSLIHKDTFYEEYDNMEKILDILRYDPDFINRLSKMNIPVFSGISIRDSFQHKIKTKTIINLLGKNCIKEILIKLFPEDMFTKIKEKDLFKQIIHHSLGVGVFSRLLSKHIGLDEDEMFVAGILHDIGKIMLYIPMPDKYETALNMAKERIMTSTECEENYFDINHSEVGIIVLKIWEYPDEFINIIKYHHNFNLIKEEPLSLKVTCLQAANILYNFSGEHVKNLRTFRVELFDKRIRDLTKKIDMKLIMKDAKIKINNFSFLFAL